MRSLKPPCVAWRNGAGKRGGLPQPKLSLGSRDGSSDDLWRSVAVATFAFGRWMKSDESANYFRRNILAGAPRLRKSSAGRVWFRDRSYGIPYGLPAKAIL